MKSVLTVTSFWRVALSWGLLSGCFWLHKLACQFWVQVPEHCVQLGARPSRYPLFYVNVN